MTPESDWAERIQLCRRCRKPFPLVSFPPRPANRSGYDTICGPCKRADYAKWRVSGRGKRLRAEKAKREASLEYRLQRNARRRADRHLEHNRERERRSTAVYAERHPEKDAAVAAVKRAISRGDLMRPEVCPRCGVVDPRRVDGVTLIQAHHADYSKPLEVEWLCIWCHASEHIGHPAANPIQDPTHD